jgi:hypothetical protein
MAAYSHLQVAIYCPSCQALITDLIWFMWGYCEQYEPHPELIYHLGDQIRWHACKDGTIPAWVYFDGRGGNKGDPVVRNLIVRAGGEFFWDATHADRYIHYDLQQLPIPYEPGKAYWSGQDPTKPKPCPSCHEPLEGVAIEIRNNIIVRASVYLPGAMDNTVDIYVINPDGTSTPMPAWNEHPMPTIRAC